MTTETPAAQAESCFNHPSVPAAGRCGVCARPICELCTFRIGEAPLICPDCLTAAAARPKQTPLGKAIGSIALAVCGVLLIGLIKFAVLIFGAQTGLTVATFGRVAALATTITGLTLGFIGRDEAGRERSVLATIGTIANGLLLAVLLFSLVIGSTSK